MENEEQPAAELSKEERIEAYFTSGNEHWDEYAFKLYKSVEGGPEFDDAEYALRYFTDAERLLYENRTRPLSAVKQLNELFDNNGLTEDQQLKLFGHLILYLNSTVYTGEDKKEFSLTKIVKLLEGQESSLRESRYKPPTNSPYMFGQMAPAVVIPSKKDFDWQATKQYLDTLPDTKAKIKHLIERRAEYKQDFDGFNVKGWGPKYDEQCQTEIKKLKDLAELEKIGQATKSPFKLSGKSGAKINLIRLLNALYELNLIELENGLRPTKEQFMQQIGGFMGVDAKDYSKDLEQALNMSIEANVKVFDELKKKITEQVLAKQKL